jgi:hypothetical protein
MSSSSLVGSHRAGTTRGVHSDMSRPLSVSPPPPPSPPPPKDQAFILGDGWTSERAAHHLRVAESPSSTRTSTRYSRHGTHSSSPRPRTSSTSTLAPVPTASSMPGPFPGGSRSSSRPTWKTKLKERHSTPPQSHRLSPSLHLGKAKAPPRHQQGWSSPSGTGTMSTSPSVAPSRSTPICNDLPTSAVVAATSSIQASVASASATPLPGSVAL